MNSPKGLEKIGLCVFLACLGIVLACTVYFRPFYGLMDDGWIMHLMVPQMREMGFLQYTWDFAWNRDLSWGMFRLTYPLLIALIYLPAQALGPMYVYIANWVLVSLITFFLCRVVGRITEIPWQWIAVACFAWLHFHDLFMHPSLQEKFLLLFGAFFIDACYRATEKESGWALCGLATFFILGILTKASFFVIVGMGLALVFAGLVAKPNRRNAGIFAFLVGVTGLALVVMAQIAANGRYTTARYDFSKIGTNLFSLDGALFGVSVLLACLGIFFDRRRGEPMARILRTWFPLAGVIAFLAMFLPWSIKAYIQTLVVVFLMATLVRSAFSLPIAKARPFFLLALAVFSIAITSYRSVTVFGRYGDLGRIVAAWQEWEAAGISQISMPCMEGAESVEKFFHAAGWRGVKVAFLPDLRPLPVGFNHAVLYDRALCPLPGRAAQVEGCREEILYSGRLSKSFKLARIADCR